MTHSLLSWAALFGAGALAGTINVIAGGGSLLTLPVLIFLGLPPVTANGTNRVAILLQNVGATASFHRAGLVPRRWLVLAAPPALVGVVVGTLAAVRIDDAAFQNVLAGVLVVAAGVMLWGPKQPDGTAEAPLPTGARRWGFALAFFLVGVYGGFIQAGIGFVMLGLASAAGLDLLRGNALKVSLVLVFTPLALAIFAWSGEVAWGAGLVLAAGNFTGAVAGVRLQVLKGQGWVRGVVTVVVVVFAVRLLVLG